MNKIYFFTLYDGSKKVNEGGIAREYGLYSYLNKRYKTKVVNICWNCKNLNELFTILKTLLFASRDVLFFQYPRLILPGIFRTPLLIKIYSALLNISAKKK